MVRRGQGKAGRGGRRAGERRHGNARGRGPEFYRFGYRQQPGVSPTLTRFIGRVCTTRRFIRALTFGNSYDRYLNCYLTTMSKRCSHPLRIAFTGLLMLRVYPTNATNYLLMYELQMTLKLIYLDKHVNRKQTYRSRHVSRRVDNGKQILCSICTQYGDGLSRVM